MVNEETHSTMEQVGDDDGHTDQQSQEGQEWAQEQGPEEGHFGADQLIQLLRLIMETGGGGYDYLTEFFGPWVENYHATLRYDTPEGLQEAMRVMTLEPDRDLAISITDEMVDSFISRCHRFGLTNIKRETCGTFLDWAAALGTTATTLLERCSESESLAMFKAFISMGVRPLSTIFNRLRMDGMDVKAEYMFSVMLGREPTSQLGKFTLGDEFDALRVYFRGRTSSPNQELITYEFYELLMSSLFGAFEIIEEAYTLKSQCSILLSTDIKQDFIDILQPADQAALMWECGSRLRLHSVFRGHKSSFDVAPSVYEETPKEERQDLLLRSLDQAAEAMRRQLAELGWHLATLSPPKTFWQGPAWELLQDEFENCGGLPPVSLAFLSLAARPSQSNFCFLSHRGADSKIPLSRMLKKEYGPTACKSECFLDCLTLSDHKDCSEVFLWRNLWKAHKFVVALTPNFLSSKWCARELLAWQLICLVEHEAHNSFLYRMRECIIVDQNSRETSVFPSDSLVNVKCVRAVPTTESLVSTIRNVILEREDEAPQRHGHGVSGFDASMARTDGFTNVADGKFAGMTTLRGNVGGFTTISSDMAVLPSCSTCEYVLELARRMMHGVQLPDMMAFREKATSFRYASEDRADLVEEYWCNARREIFELIHARLDGLSEKRPKTCCCCWGGSGWGEDDVDEGITDDQEAAYIKLQRVVASISHEEASDDISQDSDYEDFFQTFHPQYTAALMCINVLEIVRQMDIWMSHLHDPTKLSSYHAMCRWERMNGLYDPYFFQEGVFGPRDMVRPDAVDILRDSIVLRTIPLSSQESAVTILDATELREWIRTTPAAGRILAVKTRSKDVGLLLPLLLVMSMNASPIQFRILQIRNDLAVEVDTGNIPLKMVSCVTGESWDECKELLSSNLD